MQRPTNSKKGVKKEREREWGRGREREKERPMLFRGLWTKESRLSSFYMTTVLSFADV